MIHSVVRWIGSRGLRWFYRDVEVVGAEQLPTTGATLLVANHGNDLADILMTLIATRRDVRFVANVTAADSRIVNWTFAKLGVIPVARVRDVRGMRARGEDAAALNVLAFSRVREAFDREEMVVVFPEGTVHDLPHLAPMRVGAARMALQSVDGGSKNELFLTTLGIQYEKLDEPRSGVLAVIAKPISITQWAREKGADQQFEFTRFMRSQLLAVTKNAATDADLEALTRVAATVGAVISSPTLSPLAATHRVQQAISHVPTSGEHDDLTLHAIHRYATTLGAQLEALGAKPWSATDKARTLQSAGCDGLANTAPKQLLTWALTPIALFGTVLHAVPFWINWKLARRFATNRTELAARAIVPGLYLFALWYVTIPLFLWLVGIPAWACALLFVAQPRLGDIAVSWRDDISALRLLARTQRIPAAERAALVTNARQLHGAWVEFERAAQAHSRSPSDTVSVHSSSATKHHAETPSTLSSSRSSNGGEA